MPELFNNLSTSSNSTTPIISDRYLEDGGDGSFNYIFFIAITVFFLIWNTALAQHVVRSLTWLCRGKCHESIGILLCPHWIVGIVIPFFLFSGYFGPSLITAAFLIVPVGIPYGYWIIYLNFYDVEAQSVAPCCSCFRSNAAAVPVPMQDTAAARLSGKRRRVEKLLICKQVVEHGKKSGSRLTMDDGKSYRAKHPKSDIVCRAAKKKLNFPIKTSSPMDVYDEINIASGEKCDDSDDISNASSEQDSVQFCNICLEEYQVGEKIGWSRNNQCHHAFHKKCIVEWLMSHDDCPICRNTYIVDEEMG